MTTTGRLQTILSIVGTIIQWQSLKTKVTFLMLAIFMIGIWGLSFFASYTLHRDMEKTISEQQFATASIVAADINNEFVERVRTLEVVAKGITPAILGNAAAMQKLLEDRPALALLFNGGLWVARLDGVAIADVPVTTGRIGVNYRDRDWVGEVLKGKAIIGEPVMGKKLKASVLPMGVPIRDPDGNVIGLLTGATDLGQPNFLQRITAHGYGKTGDYVLVSPNLRTIVFSTDKKRISEVLPAIGVNPFIDRAMQGWEGSGVLVNPHGVHVLSSVIQIPMPGWYIAMMMPTKDIFAPIHRLRGRIFLASVFMTLLAGALIGWLLKRQLAPALATIKTLASLADTNQPQSPLPITRHDEIGALIGGFNRLLETLGKRGEALQESEERNRTILQTAMDGFWLTDMQGRLLQVNETWCRMSGYSEQEILGGMRIQDFMAHGSDEIVAARINHIMTGRGDTFFESSLRRKDGSVFDAEVGVKHLLAYGGRMVVVLRNITERKQAQQVLVTHEALRLTNASLEQRVAERAAELKEVSAQLQLAVSVAEVGIWDWDVVSNHLSWDAVMYKLYGITPDKFGGAYESWEAGLHPEDREEAGEVMQRALRGDGEFNPEFRVVWPDGSIHWIKANALIQRDREGKPLRMTGTNWDITVNKLVVQAADAANRAKSTFLANMSHEIRTPMNGVLGMTGLLLDTELTSQQRNYAEKIRISGVSLLSIINDILDISKIEAGKIALESIPFSAKAVIGNVVNSFEAQMGEKKVAFYSILDPELPAVLMGDPQRLTQVLTNLVGNAVKFTTTGFIRLVAKVKRRTAMDVELEIGVEDTGIGMTAEEMSRLFTSFSQADASMTRIFGGTGLGLTISRNLVELMGGTVQVDSVAGKGSLFTILISLPISKELPGKDLQSATIYSGRIRFTGVRALVVEDRPINMEILVELLQKFGIEAPDIAGNGREAVAMVRDNDYDILFMDIQMPEMDGITATREIRNLNKTGVDCLPIIAMTAQALKGDRQKSLDAGMNDHLNKPIDPETLGAALQQWLPPEKCTAVAAGESGRVANTDRLFIPPIPGLDVEGWRARMGDNQELYLKLLRNFVADHRDTPAQLLQELRADQWEAVLHRAHAIRGVIGNLGGLALENAAKELENACRAAGNTGNGVPCSLGEPLRIFIDCLEAQILAISTILVQYPVIAPIKPEGPPVNRAELRELLEQLQRLLTRQEPQPCVEILRTLRQMRLPEDQETVLAELSLLVQRYRLADALVFLNKNITNVIENKEEKVDA